MRIVIDDGDYSLFLSGLCLSGFVIEGMMVYNRPVAELISLAILVSSLKLFSYTFRQVSRRMQANYQTTAFQTGVILLGAALLCTLARKLVMKLTGLLLAIVLVSALATLAIGAFTWEKHSVRYQSFRNLFRTT